ncbi:hypothetical protein HRI_000430900 [Hibiscus trionum]|uniref:Reverse transcriptase domain-containing protein n=1 Tax=Hibiscus trionum TaxID=183268 RepID=A0A9W7H0S4_HIBTR|nr:hypothetical protein HRI_000430900 [Hibiscus trionum]
MGFGSRWCGWIKECLESARISVLVNGSHTKTFSISKGLRQGWPMSPFLFNVVAEALSSFLSKAISKGLFNRFRIGTEALELSHLQFADDLIIFCGNSEAQVRNVVRLLKGFELASGLKINLEKSKLIGINVDSEKIEL